MPTSHNPLPIRLPYGMLLTAALLIGCGDAPDRETIAVRKGSIEESFNEPAKTRLEQTHLISMPVDGRIGRIDLEPGDPVTKGQALAEFDREPLEQEVAEARAAVAELEASIAVKSDHRLENTALINAQATVRTMTETLNAADAQVEAQKARADRAASELDRMSKLAAENAITQQKLEDIQLDAETSTIDLRKQEFYRAALKAFNVAVHLGPKFVDQYIAKKSLELAVLEHQRVQAQARLVQAQHRLRLARVESPIDGVVLERFEQGDDAYAPGDPLLLLGDLSQLEVESDVLTQDALRLAEGSAVELEPAARLSPLAGKVKRIEPAGFTKISSLGIEQQRVRVIVGFDEPPTGLGVGYHVQARFVTGTNPEALIVPRYAVLQAPDGGFYVLAPDADGEWARKPVTLGLRGDLELEVVSGLAEGDLILAHPDTTLGAN